MKKILVTILWALCSCQRAPVNPVLPEAESVSPGETLVVENRVRPEMRGIWITRFSWESREQLMGMLDHVSAVGFNTVFFQVRGNFDAYYFSDLEPWAERLTGQLGQDPGWDPLAEVVRHGHELGLEVHAYLNTYPFWRGPEAPSSTGVPHPLELHPEWLVVDEEGLPMALNDLYVFASPGNSEVRNHIVAVAVDIVSRYEVDGLHFDYIRYPGAQYSHDEASLARMAEEPQPIDRVAWQTRQPSELLERVGERTSLPITAAVWGIYEDRFGWGRVSEGLHDYHQDSHAWLEAGLVDAIVPMIYWGVSDEPGSRLDFSTLLEDHRLEADGRHVFAGIGGESIDFDQVLECIEETRRQGAAGTVLFDYSLFADDLYRLGSGLYSESAVPPVNHLPSSSGVGSAP